MTTKTRDQIANQDKWDLSKLYTNDDQWRHHLETINQKIIAYNEYTGRLADSANELQRVLEFDLDMSRQWEKIYTYAHLKSDEDKGNQLYLGMLDQAISMYNKIQELSSFISPEIQAMTEKTFDSFLQDPALSPYRFYLQKIYRYKPHTLDKETERVLAMSGDLADTAQRIFSQLDNVDIRFGDIELPDGQTIEITHGNWNSLLMHTDRNIRQKAFHQYYQSYQDQKNTLAMILGQSIKKDNFFARVKKYSDSRAMSLFEDNIKQEVYDNLIHVVSESLNPLMEYLTLRKSKLGLENLHFYDTYVPLISSIDFEMPYDEAVEVCCQALAPLGEDYTNTMRQGLLRGWVDRYENKGKRSGAYSSGCYDSPPYILLNYESGNINSLYTLIHEAGHSMHSYLSKKNQPYHSSEYTIFVAEVASTFNEILLSKYLLEQNADNPSMQAYILNREIDNIRGTFYRQTMFAEFEKNIHSIANQNQPLTLETMTEQYQTLLQKYFGHAMIIDKELQLEFLRIPHFYSAFYVYKYATGISAAIALAQNIIGKELDSQTKKENTASYLRFLSLGGSQFPLDELAAAGIDMTSIAPIKQCADYFATLVNKLQQY